MRVFVDSLNVFAASLCLDPPKSATDG